MIRLPDKPFVFLVQGGDSPEVVPKAEAIPIQAMAEASRRAHAGMHNTRAFYKRVMTEMAEAQVDDPALQGLTQRQAFVILLQKYLQVDSTIAPQITEFAAKVITLLRCVAMPGSPHASANSESLKMAAQIAWAFAEHMKGEHTP